MYKLTTNYKAIEMLAPKRKKRNRKKSKAKLQIVKKPEKLAYLRYPSERDILRKLDEWV